MKNPRDTKIDLAKELIARFHSGEDAEAAHQDFIQRFVKNADLVNSTSEAMCMIKQGAVKLDGGKVDNTKYLFAESLQVGKRKFARITFK